MKQEQPMILLSLAASNPPTYGKAIAAAGGNPVGGYLPEMECPAQFDGLLLGGGGDLDPAWYGAINTASEEPDAKRDAAEAQLIQAAVRKKIPILGICRGMQVLTGVLGGTLVQDLGSAHSMVGERYRLHGTDLRSGSTLARLYGMHAVVNSGHHQAVKTLAPGFAATQWACDGVIEAIEHQTLPIIGVQWHPEQLCGNARPMDSVDGMALFCHFIACCKRNAERSHS